MSRIFASRSLNIAMRQISQLQSLRHNRKIPTSASNSIRLIQTEAKMSGYQLGNPPSEIDNPRVSLLLEISNAPGSLHELLRYFWKYDIDLTHIESRPTPKGNEYAMR